MIKRSRCGQSARALLTLMTAASAALASEAHAAARKTEPRYACGGSRLTVAEIAGRFGVSQETIERIPGVASVSYEEFCKLSPKLRHEVIEKVDEEARTDRPDEAVRFRLLSLVDENGEIPERAPARAFRQVQALRRRQKMALAATESATNPAAARLASTSWTWLGPGNVGGRMRAGVINPNNADEILVGSTGGGIWRTTNRGTSWAPVADFMANLAVTSIAFTPGDWSVQYAATGEGFANDGIRGAGIFKSADGGLSWSQLVSTDNPDFYYTNRVAVSGDMVLAATNSGLYRSVDAGSSFVQTRTAGATDIKLNPTDGTRAVAGFGSGGAVFSVDGGATWTDATGLPAIANGGRVELAYAPGNTNTVYASVNSLRGLIYRSTDGGRSYVRQTSGAPGYLSDQGFYSNALWIDPTNANTLIVGGVDLWRSTDGGATLTKISQWFNWPTSAHADHHLVLTDPGFNGSSNRIAYDLNDGGIYRITDTNTAQDTTGFTVLNNGLGITQFYNGAATPGGTFAGGTQDNGTVCTNPGDTTSQWKFEYGGDGGATEIDPTDSNYIYGEYIYANIHRSTSGCQANAGHVLLAQQNGANFIAPIVLDPSNPNTLLVGAGALLRTQDAKSPSPSFTTIKPDIGSPISALAIAPSNSGIILVGHNNGNIYRTIGGTATTVGWGQIEGLPRRMVTALAVDGNDTNIYYVAFGGFASDNIYKSTDAGGTWTNIHGSLPAMPVRSIAIHPSAPSWLFIGTELGVFTSTTSGGDWHTTNDGPANVSVEDVFFVGNTLYAFTHGRGAYKAEIPPPSPAEMISPAPGSTLDGSSVGFSWTSGVGASQYWLWVGTGPGTADVYSADQGTATSTTVSGLPVDGRGLFVRLWSLIGNSWQYRDYVYATHTVAEMTTPTPGSTLSSDVAPFSWTTGSGVLRYWLYVGSGVGEIDLYGADQGTRTALTILGLPTDGRTLYVRLWSLLPAGWEYRDYTYGAFAPGPTPAVIWRPATGATLGGSSATFSWTSGSQVLEYWLYVGNGVGMADLYNADQGTSLSTTVNDLPTDGRTLFVRLWSRVGPGWQARDFTYKAFAPGPTPAVIWSPQPGSALSGSSSTFNWTTGSAVSQYWLYVGSSLGATDIYSASQGTATSTTVAGLPTDGRTVFARLWSLINGVWQFRDHTYTASPFRRNPRAVVSPLRGAETQGWTTWTAGTEVESYLSSTPVATTDTSLPAEAPAPSPLR